jgi:cysteinyl-tRNA synthetase
MSKSLGNFLTIDDIIAKGYSPLALRLLFLQSHYRSEMNFTWHALESSSTALQKLIQKAKLLVDVATDASFWNDFESALSDDLNTPQAIAHLFAHVQARTLGARDFLRACEVLGLSDVLGYGKCEVPVELQELAQKRAAAKRSKDYTTADAMRAQIETAGYRVRDLSDGTSVVEKA